LAKQAGVAVYMQRTDITTTSLLDTINYVRNNPQMDYDCARMSLIYREAGGLKKAVQVIESALKLGNSHLLPHSYKLNWYQAENYDAVLLIIVMIVISCWVILARRGFVHCCWCKKLKTN
jgi:glucuronosyltransferase